jgi:hypothetical protein
MHCGTSSQVFDISYTSEFYSRPALGAFHTSKNYYIWGFLEVPAGILVLNHFWIQEGSSGFRS